MEVIEALLKKVPTSLVVHLVRMEDKWAPQTIFFGELENSRRAQSGQCRRFKDELNSSL